MFALVATVFLSLIAHGHASMKATAVLYDNNSTNNRGTLTFTQDDATTFVKISGTLSGLNVTSAHGFHIHALPVSEGNPDCVAAGLHFNPYNVSHGPITAGLMGRHVGDLGNLTTDSSGSVTVNIQDFIIQLYNATQNITGRTVVVHRMRDDGGTGGFSDSNTTGNAGMRVLCGLIKLSTDSHGLSIQPTLSLLLLSILIATMMFTQ